MVKTSRLESLDTLRGIAVFMVIAFHVSIPFTTTGLFSQVLLLGNSGVQLFFLISAITMCYMWERRQGESFPTRKFYVRRAFRIAPPFWFALLFYTGVKLLSPSGLGDISGLDFILTTLFLHGFSIHAINLAVPGGWSIAVEMSFYLIFPLLVLKFKSPLQRLVLAFGCYLGTLVLTHLLRPWLPTEGLDQFLYYSMLTQLPVFPLGMAFFSVVMGKQKIDFRGAALILGLWLGLAFLGKSLDLLTRPMFWVQVFSFLGFMALVLKKGLHWKPLSFLGQLSYSLYLFHFAVLDLVVGPLAGRFFQGLPDYFLGLALTLGLTILVAWISGRTLEAWSSTWAKKFIEKVLPDPKPSS